MNAKQKKRWILDAALFGGLILACFVGLTGVALHQWLGIVLGGAAAYHLFTHLDWVGAVAARFRKATGTARLYFLLDLALLAGFTLMIGSGLVISTWLNLNLSNYLEWRNLHVAATIVTLPATALKLALHRNWILQVARKFIFAPASSAARPRPAAAAPVSRRAFLGLLGGIGAATALALDQSISGLTGNAGVEPVQASGGTAAGLANAAAGSLPTPTGHTTALPTAAPALEPTQAASPAPTLEPTLAPSPTALVPTAAPANEVNPVSAAPAASDSTACRVQCGKRCAFPGRCRRYTDANANGRCDLGECA